MTIEPQTRERDRIPLDRQRVLQAAVQLADREGIEALSMRRVGQQLGVEAMSLYNHVANKEDLLDGMLDVVLSEIDPPLTDEGDWRRIFHERVMTARRALKRHPWASTVIVSRVNPTPHMLAYMDSMIGIVRRAGFSLDLTHHAMHALGSRTMGFAQELFEDSADAGADPAVMDLMIKQMAEQFPYAAEIATKVRHDNESVVGSGCDDQFEFEFGLNLILDGLERLRSEQGAAAS
ncbi:MAG TPA: TetR/AcrR family transcriptional regulator C-terminal domain-containing protein [Candidatus Limnocylindrales bacterium]|nr:TetR/AcrR family transcriptional regulator C-terminal domain-containing protein [Candidatus Limnocylindrales bacterium]